MNVLVYK